MKTLALLAVMFLVALQARAELLMVNADEVVDQQQSGAEDQDVAVYVKEGESSILEALGVSTGIVCTCRRRLCVSRERRSGVCIIRGARYPLCCRR
ncbi:corticostatin-3-like [Ochotona curzoniae]|uniref:corticostatin-3-like n=1 Tax=Ochotona curzoniae TaxID=130825 RepID=UPI001B34A557|nr:corticostatin-3-like [Ochotona curzoniae]